MRSILLTSSILILLLAALRPLLRGRIDPRMQYALWLIVALRLLLPVELAPSAYSALALLQRAEAPARVAQAIGSVPAPVPVMSYEDAYAQALREYGQDRPDAAGDPDSDRVEVRARELTEHRPTLTELAATYARPVWLGGAVLVGLWFALVNLRLRRKLRNAEPVESEVPCPLSVYVSRVLPSPCLCGALRPKIYITPAALENGARLRHVLSHELTHYRHWDHWWALVRCLCLCVYWFDPLVWWAADLSRRDCELACDEGAIHRLGEAERIPYGRTLVDMIAAGRTSLLQTATTMTGEKRRVRERIRLIARRPRTVLAAALALAVVLVCAVGCTFTGAPESEAPSPSQTVEPTPDTLQARLLDLPEDLRDHVEAHGDNDALASYYFRKPGEPLDKAQYLLVVEQLSQERFDELFDGLYYSSGGSHPFARGDGQYYVFYRNTSIEYNLEDEEMFSAAQLAVRDYVEKTVLETEGVEQFVLASPQTAQDQLTAAIDRILAAPGITLTLAPAGTSRLYAYPAGLMGDSLSSWSSRIQSLPAQFAWEYLGSVAENLPEKPQGDTLVVETPEGSSIQVWSSSHVMLIRESSGGAGTAYFEAQGAEGDPNPLGTPRLNPGPYQILREWFDQVELAALRVTTVSDRGQSHEEIARAWAEGYEGALTKVAPGSGYACTSMEIVNLEADLPNWLEGGELEEFAQSHGFAAEEFGRTWFGFGYETVFVPVDQSTASPFWAGNTWYYEGGDAPAGALTYSRISIMERVNGGWHCEGAGTGW